MFCGPVTHESLPTLLLEEIARLTDALGEMTAANAVLQARYGHLAQEYNVLHAVALAAIPVITGPRISQRKLDALFAALHTYQDWVEMHPEPDAETVLVQLPTAPATVVVDMRQDGERVVAVSA